MYMDKGYHKGDYYMTFQDSFNKYIDILDCSIKDLADASGLSASTISRYKTGERKPFADSEQLQNLVNGIVQIATDKNISDIKEKEVYFELKKALTDQSDLYAAFSKNFATISDSIKINMKELATAINFDLSYLYRIRSGQRHPNDLDDFADLLCKYIVRNHADQNTKDFFADYTGCDVSDLSTETAFASCIIDALFLNHTDSTDKQMETFLKKLDDFNLDEYIRAIHFDKLKVPHVPFYFPVSKTYYGIEQMRQGELDFFKATVLSKSYEPIFMCSDMPMTKLAEDMDFNKKWMFAIAMALKKGLHLNIIHNVDRPFEEMMLGLEAWIPLYMTGQISPYHLKNISTEIYHHFTYVSGAVALSGECIDGYHENGKYHLSTSKEELAYYHKKADHLLQKASPLMEIYIKDDAFRFETFLKKTAEEENDQYNILSSLPIYTLSKELLLQIIQKEDLSSDDVSAILNFYEKQKEHTSTILKQNMITDNIPEISREEFEKNPLILSLSEMFIDKEIFYTYDEYLQHINYSKEFAKNHDNYHLQLNQNSAFRNIQIRIVPNHRVLISKSKTPVIHFAIYHPKMVNALQNFIAPVFL